MKYAALCFILMLASTLFGADFYQGQLFLEVNLETASQLKISPASASNRVLITEQEGLISREFGGGIKISLVNPEALSYYGIIEKSLIVSDDKDYPGAVPRLFFAWENQHLIIKRELLYFSSQSFSTITEAESYARLQGIPLSKIMPVPVINSTVMVQADNAEAMYLETPLLISSASELRINGAKLGYSGDFVLKTVNGKLVLNHYLALEDYLAGVVQNEIGNTSPLEALKAQAVASRTHAISLLLNNRHKADGYELCNSTHCQVYKGKYLQSNYIRQAVKETESEVLYANEGIADATYHSSCGGKTDASSKIWKGKPISHLNGVTCIEAADSLNLSVEADARKWIDTKPDSEGLLSWERGALSWSKSITNKQLAANIGLNYISRIEILERSRSGRIISMKFIGNSQVLLDNEYKIRLAWGNLLSSFFYIRGNYKTENKIIEITPKATLEIHGRGAGHGVGMCQVGALKMAREGKSYSDILAHYYPGTTLHKDWFNE